MSTLALAAIVAGSALILAVVLLSVGDYRFVAQLRRSHPAAWQSLGSPSPWFTKLNDLTTVNDYLARRGYLVLPDPDLIKLGNHLRLLTHLVYWLAGITLLLVGAARLKR